MEAINQYEKKADEVAEVVISSLIGMLPSHLTTINMEVQGGEDQTNIVYLDKAEGAESTNVTKVTKSSAAEELSSDIKPFGLQVNLGPVKESEQEVAQWDVEKVIEQQQTHDLYCPNCKSCITKRVILRKRKRPTRPDEGPSAVEPDSPVNTPPPAIEEEREGFPCFSCFSIFIPTVEGLKRCFGLNTPFVSFQSPGAGDAVIPIPDNDDQTAPLILPVRDIPIPEAGEWDILKSIVYGGLVEVITSLGVISSAAGGDAKTLNIVALGVANLVTGFPILVQSILDMKNEPRGRTSEVEEENVDRYEQVLGKRNNFRRHAVLAVLSYLIFGLLPPLVYGFSFRETDDKNYKLIAVAAASIICIILLATGRAHTKNPPKSYIKTIFHYVVTGVMASGLSFVFGQLIKELLEKLALFGPNAVAPVPPSSAFLQTISSSANSAAWTSY